MKKLIIFGMLMLTTLFGQVKELTDGSSAFDQTDLDNAKWFYYNAGSDEKYIGCVVGASGSPYGQIHVWNTTDLVKCTVNYHSAARAYLNAVNSTDYDVLTVRDTSIITNKTKVVTTVAGDSFTAKTVGSLIQGQLQLETGVLRVPVYCNSKDARITVNSKEWHPIALQSADWEALQVLRSQRI